MFEILQLENFKDIFNNTSDTFNKLIQTVSPHIDKQDTDVAEYLGYSLSEVLCLARLLGNIWKNNNNTKMKLKTTLQLYFCHKNK